MKKFFVVLALLAFACAAPFAMAADKKAEKKLNCCVKGKVEKLTKAECTTAGGAVVKSAKQCKAPK
ncbi:MAG: hypothetical protein V1792_24815 [Pseudomonadota bacterium]